MKTKTLNALELHLPHTDYFDLYYKGDSLGQGKTLNQIIDKATRHGFTHIYFNYSMKNARKLSVKTLIKTLTR